MVEWVWDNNQRPYFKDDQWFLNDNPSQHTGAKRIHVGHEEGMALINVWVGLICLGPVTFPCSSIIFFFRTFWPFDIAQFFLVYELQVILRATSPFLGVYIKIQLRKPGAIMLLHYLFLLIFWGQSVKSMWNILTFSFLNKAKHTMRKYYFGDYFFTLKINCCTQYTYKIRWEYLKF